MASVHAEYLRAGADVIETNTFGANRIKLRAFGLSDKVAAINLEGARIARPRRASRGLSSDRCMSRARSVRSAFASSRGARPAWTRPSEYFREQAEALVEGQVDLFILETFRDLNEIGAAIAAIRSLSALPIVAQMTTEEDGNSLDGTPPEQFAPALLARGANVVGVNCSVGPAPMLETIERLAERDDRRLSAKPNAGKPRDIEGRNIYCVRRNTWRRTRGASSAGVRLVGGCCGTTPEHIRQIKGRRGNSRWRPGLAPRAVWRRGRCPRRAPNAQSPVARARSRASRKLDAGSSSWRVELVPPRGLSTRR